MIIPDFTAFDVASYSNNIECINMCSTHTIHILCYVTSHGFAVMVRDIKEHISQLHSSRIKHPLVLC